MKNLICTMRQSITSVSLDALFASRALYVSGLFIFAMSILKIEKFALTEAQLFFALLLIIGVTMQMIIAGMLLESRSKSKVDNGHDR